MVRFIGFSRKLGRLQASSYGSDVIPARDWPGSMARDGNSSLQAIISSPN
jgi:hypothetical protein